MRGIPSPPHPSESKNQRMFREGGGVVVYVILIKLFNEVEIIAREQRDVAAGWNSLETGAFR